MTNSNSNTVSVLEVQLAPTFLGLVETIPVGQEPSGIAATRPGSFADGDLVYVANREVGNGPKGIAAGLLPMGP